MTISIPLVTLPIGADKIQSAINALIDQINTSYGGLDPANAVITGGSISNVTIDNSVIGGVTPSTGNFTALTALTGSINSDTIVTRTAAQTLTNKSLTAPLITGGTIDNAVIGGLTAAAITGTTITANTGFVGNLTGAVTGNASSATVLQTGRTIAIGGTTGLTATGVSFNGSAGISLTLSGTLALANGGTNANLSATGGASQVLQQSSSGAAITVGQLAASNLSNGTIGSGAVVLATSPTLVTPILGVATATTLNKITLTQPATGATLTIIDGKTLTSNNSLILAGTDSTTITFQGTDTYVGRATTDTLTNKTINGSNNTITNVNLTTGVTGNLLVTSLNSGVGANGSTFWRGDGAWVAPTSLINSWVRFAGSTGTITASANVSSVTRNGVGDYTINFTSNLPSANYAVSGAAQRGATNDDCHVAIANAAAPTASALRVTTVSGAAAIDCTIVTVMTVGG